MIHNAGMATPPTTPINPNSLQELKMSDVATSLEQYRNDVTSARRNLAWKLVDAFKALDELSEKEFIEIMKTYNDGITASELVEKFRMYKDMKRTLKKKKRHEKKPTKKEEPPF